MVLQRKASNFSNQRSQNDSHWHGECDDTSDLARNYSALTVQEGGTDARLFGDRGNQKSSMHEKGGSGSKKSETGIIKQEDRRSQLQVMNLSLQAGFVRLTAKDELSRSSMTPPHPPLPERDLHILYGSGQRALAAMCCALNSGPVLWIFSRASQGEICPQGIGPFFNPSRLVVAFAQNAMDALWTCIEALSCGAFTGVVCEYTAHIDLNTTRRLQLAAKKGRSLGLLLSDIEQNFYAARSRWRCTPLPSPGPTARYVPLWRLELVKSRQGFSGTWEINWHETENRLHVVSASVG